MAELKVNIDVQGFDGLTQVGSTMRLIDKLAGDNKLYFATQESRKAFLELVSTAGDLEKEMSKTKDSKYLNEMSAQLRGVRQQISDYIREAVYAEKVMGGEFATAVSRTTEELSHNKRMVETTRAEIEKLGDALALTKARYGAESQQYKDQKTELSRLKSSISGYEDEAKRAQESLNSLKAAQAVFGASSVSAGGSLEQFIQKLQQVPTVGEKASSSLRSLKGMVGDLGFALVGGLGLEQLTQRVFTTRSQFQQLEVSFGTMLGDAGKAKTLMDQLIDTAAKTPFDMMSITSGAKQLLAYGTAANEVNDILTRLGDISAGLNIPLGDLVYLYGTTMTQGRMYTQDLRQFMGRGIPMAEELAKQFGVSKDEVGSLVTQGKVGAEQVKKAIFDMTAEGGKFGGLMEKQSHTLQGQWSNLGDTVDQMINEIGKSSEGAFNSALSFLSAIIENWKTVGKVIGTVVAAVGAYKAGLMVAASVEKNQMLGGLDKRIQDSQLSIAEGNDKTGGLLGVRNARRKIRDDFAEQATENLDKALDDTIRKRGEELEKQGILRKGLTDEIMQRREIARQVEAQADNQKEQKVLQDARNASLEEEERKQRVLAEAERQRRIEEARSNAERLKQEAENARNSPLLNALADNKAANANVASTKSNYERADRNYRDQQAYVEQMGRELGAAADYDAVYQGEIEKIDVLREKRAQAKSEYLAAVEQQKKAYQSLVDEVLKNPEASGAAEQYNTSKRAYEQDKADLEVQEQKLATIKAQIEEEKKRDISDVAIGEGGTIGEEAFASADRMTNLKSQLAEQEKAVADTRAHMEESYNSMTEAIETFNNAQKEDVRQQKENAEAAEDAAQKAQELADTLQGATTSVEENTVAKDTNSVSSETNEAAQAGENAAKTVGTAENSTNATAENANSVAKDKNAVSSNSSSTAQGRENVAKAAGTTENSKNTVTENLNTEAKTKNALSTRISDAAQKMWTNTVKSARLAWSEFTMSLLANPFTAIITAITTVISLVMTFTGILDIFTSKEEGAMDSMSKAADDASAKTKILFAQLQVVNGDSQIFRDTVANLTEEYKKYGITLDDTIMKVGTENEKKQELLSHEQELIEAIRTEAIEREKANQIESIEKKFSDKRNEVWEDNLGDTGLDDSQLTTVKLTLEGSGTFQQDIEARSAALEKYQQAMDATMTAQALYGTSSDEWLAASERQKKAYDDLSQSTARSEEALIKLVAGYGRNIDASAAHTAITEIISSLDDLNKEHDKEIGVLENGAREIDGYNAGLKDQSSKAREAEDEQEKLSYWYDATAQNSKKASDSSSSFGQSIRDWVDASVTKATLDMQGMAGVVGNMAIPVFNEAGKQVGTLPPVLNMVSSSSGEASESIESLGLNVGNVALGFGSAGEGADSFAGSASAAVGEGASLNGTLSFMWGAATDAKGALESMVPSTLDPKEAFPRLLSLMSEIENDIDWVNSHPICPQVDSGRIFNLNKLLGEAKGMLKDINGTLPGSDKIAALQERNKAIASNTDKRSADEYAKNQREIERLQKTTAAGRYKESQKSDKAAESARKKAESERKQAAQRERQRQDTLQKEREGYSKTLSDFIANEHQTMTDNDIKAMEEGTDKEIAQIKNDTEKQLKAIDDRYKRLADARKKLAMGTWINQGKGKEKRTEAEWKKTSEGSKDDQYWLDMVLGETDSTSGKTLREMRQGLIDGVTMQSGKNLLKIQLDTTKNLDDYLKQFGSLGMRKEAINDEYDRRAANETDQWKLATIEKERQSELTKAEIDDISNSMDWGDVFGNFGTLSQSLVAPLINKLQAVIGSDAFRQQDYDSQAKVYEMLDKLRDMNNVFDSGMFTKLNNAISDYRASLSELAKAQQKELELSEDTQKAYADYQAALEMYKDATKPDENGKVDQERVEAAQSNLDKMRSVWEEKAKAESKAADSTKSLANNVKRYSDVIKTQASKISNNIKSVANAFSSFGQSGASLQSIGDTFMDLDKQFNGGKVTDAVGGWIGGLFGKDTQSVVNKDLQDKLTKDLSNVQGLDWQTVQKKLDTTIDSATDISDADKAAMKKQTENAAKQSFAAQNSAAVGSLVTGILAAAGSNSASIWGAIISAILSLLDAFKEYGLGGVVKALLDSITHAIEGIIDNMFDVFKFDGSGFNPQIVAAVGNLVGGILDSLANGLTLGGFNKWFGIGGNAKEVEKTISDLTDQNKSLQRAIEDLTDEMKSAKGANAISTSKRAYELQKQTNDNYKKIAQEQARYTHGHHSFNHYWGGFDDEQIERLNEQFEANGLSHDWTGDLFELSPEQMKILRTNVDMWQQIRDTGKGGYGERVADKLDDYIEQAGKLEEINNQLNEALTTTSKDNVFDNFLNSLYELADGSSDVFDEIADNWQAMVNKMVINNLIGEKYQKELENWWNKLADLNKKKTEDPSSMTDEEYKAALAASYQEYQGYVESAQNDMQALEDVGIIKPSGSYSQKASSGTYQTMSQETGEELSGRFTAVQEAVEGIWTQVIQINSKMGPFANTAFPLTDDSDAILSQLSALQDNNKIEVSDALFDALKATASDYVGYMGIADEGRTILAQSFMELRELNERQSGWERPFRLMFSQIKDIRDDIHSKL